MTSPSKRSPSNRQKAQPRTELRVEPQPAASILDPRALQILTAEHGMNDRTLNAILRNPIYNGRVTRKGERSPAAWRESPAVDELWARVARASLALDYEADCAPADRGSRLSRVAHSALPSAVRVSITQLPSRRAVASPASEAEVTVVALDTGEILSTHRIEPDKGYWRNTRRDPGRWPGSQATGGSQ